MLGGVDICASVKANAYGHGFVEVARILREMNVRCLGVATPWEGRELRAAGDSGCVILYGPSSEEEIPAAVEADLQPMVTHESYLLSFARLLKERGVSRRPVHLKVDTGMGRVGFMPEDALRAARLINQSPQLELAGLATHFPVADSVDPGDREFTRSQFALLMQISRRLRSGGIDPGVIHVSNSGGIALHPEMNTPGMMVRPGIALYGYGPALPVDEPQRPVMELRTKISAIKKIRAGTSISYGRTWHADEDCWIATLPVGYADGYPRLMSNRAEVLIGGRCYPVAGTVCMDQCMVNLGPETDAGIGDIAILFGPDGAGPNADDIAGLAGTISYEITCGISARVPRQYVN